MTPGHSRRGTCSFENSTASSLLRLEGARVRRGSIKHPPGSRSCSGSTSRLTTSGRCGRGIPGMRVECGEDVPEAEECRTRRNCAGTQPAAQCDGESDAPKQQFLAEGSARWHPRERLVGERSGTKIGSPIVDEYARRPGTARLANTTAAMPPPMPPPIPGPMSNERRAWVAARPGSSRGAPLLRATRTAKAGAASIAGMYPPMGRRRSAAHSVREGGWPTRHRPHRSAAFARRTVGLGFCRWPVHLCSRVHSEALVASR
jgi:hypothetical protein